MIKKIALFTFALFHTFLVVAGGDEDGKDTTAIEKSALESVEFSIGKMSEVQVVSLIDSLLELEEIPHGLIEKINQYSKNQFLHRRLHVKLTNFYDTSIYPSNSMYGSWDTHQLYPYGKQLRKNDDKTNLVIQDLASFCAFVPPIKGLITSNFGWRDGRNHNGIDIDLQVWDTVKAAFGGMVRIARNHAGGYGRVVIIRHYNGLETLYAHLHRLKVKPGDHVEAGDLIGLGGSSGRSTGSHLHFELRFKGRPLNPRAIIDFNDNKLISDSIQLINHKWSYDVIPLGVKYHVVSRGETLYRIAKRYGKSIEEICHINGIYRNKPLYVGQKIRIGG